MFWGYHGHYVECVLKAFFPSFLKFYSRFSFVTFFMCLITQSLALSFPVFPRMLSSGQWPRFLGRQVRLIFFWSLLFLFCPRVLSIWFIVRFWPMLRGLPYCPCFSLGLSVVIVLQLPWWRLLKIWRLWKIWKILKLLIILCFFTSLFRRLMSMDLQGMWCPFFEWPNDSC
jgi:hypothetical protein